MEIKNHEGDLLTDPEEVKERLGKYWEELGKSVGAGRHTYRTGRPRGRNGSGGHDWECGRDQHGGDSVCTEELRKGEGHRPRWDMLMFGGEKMISSMRVLAVLYRAGGVSSGVVQESDSTHVQRW